MNKYKHPHSLYVLQKYSVPRTREKRKEGQCFGSHIPARRPILSNETEF
jgi:hypothetical protein